MSPEALCDLLGLYPRRALAEFYAAWQQRPDGVDAVPMPFAHLSEVVARNKPSRVRPAIDVLVNAELIERAGTLRSPRGHPRNLYRVLSMGEAVGAALRRAGDVAYAPNPERL